MNAATNRCAESRTHLLVAHPVRDGPDERVRKLRGVRVVAEDGRDLVDRRSADGAVDVNEALR